MSRYEFKLVSSGLNRPSIDLDSTAVADTAAAIHHSFARTTSTFDVDVTPIGFDLLVREGLAKGTLQNPSLCFPVFTREDAESCLPAAAIVKDLTDMVTGALPSIVRYCSGIRGLSHLPFPHASLFVLSNVLFDEFQISSIEEMFLSKSRPSRAGGEYYIALMENETPHKTEAFGIYGNDTRRIASQFGIHVYGKRRYRNGLSMAYFDQEDIERWGFDGSQTTKDVRYLLALDVLRLVDNPGTQISPMSDRALSQLGLVDEDSSVRVALLDQTDLHALDALAKRFAPALLGVLHQQETAIRDAFGKSPYAAQGVRFEEWFIWWYHFLYTAVTDRLAEAGALHVPPTGNTTYFTIKRRSDGMR